jgi:hypothetical protein
MDSKRVIAIILNYYSSADTLRLCRQIKSVSPGISILVVDNSNDSAEEVSLLNGREHYDHLIVNDKNLGYAGGNNVGLKYAMSKDADYVMILNPDVELVDDVCSGLIALLERDEKLIAIAPRLCFRHDRAVIYSDGGYILKDKYFETEHFNFRKDINEKDLPVLTVPDYLSGCFLIIRVSLLKVIGLFNESFFLYYEETDWFWRAKRMGYEFKVDISHTAYIKSSSKGFRYHYYMTRNRLWLNWLYDRQNFNRAILRLVRKQLVQAYHLSFIKKKSRISYFGKWKGLWGALITKPQPANN